MCLFYVTVNIIMNRVLLHLKIRLPKLAFYQLRRSHDCTSSIIYNGYLTLYQLTSRSNEAEHGLRYYKISYKI